MNKQKIFLSYTLKGNDVTISFLNKLRTWLEAKNLTTYIDFLDNEYNAANFQKKLEAELLSSDIFLIVNSARYEESHWANIELQAAIKANLEIINIEKRTLEALMQTKDFDYLKKHYQKKQLAPA